MIYRGADVHVEEQDLLSNGTVRINVNYQIQELRQEQENISEHEPNTTVPPPPPSPTPEEEDDFLGLDYSIHDYSFLETYIFMN